MPVTLRRHLRTVKVEGIRVVPKSAMKDGIRAGRGLLVKNGAMRIKSYSSEVDRAMRGAATAQRAFGIKKPVVKLRKEIGWAGFFVDEKKAMEVLEKQYGNDEVKARDAWLRGNTFGGSLRPAKEYAENIIKKRFGFALALEGGKAGAGTKGFPRRVLLDNVTHSWIVESVVARLTKGMKSAPKMLGLPKETTGIEINFAKQRNGKLRVQMKYEEFSGDVTKNFAECMPSSVKKYLDI